MPDNHLPLSDLLVIDFTRLLPGPLATMILADLGARVVKVETPSSPDLLRFPPPHQDGSNATFATLNRDKESVVIDILAPEGPEIFRRLTRRADILLTSSRPRWLSEKGLGFDLLRRDNPRLIACNLGAYPTDSEQAGDAGHDINFCAAGGLATLMGEAEPVLPKVQFCDLAGGMEAVVAILAALHQRQRTGEGVELYLSLQQGAELYTLLPRIAAGSGSSELADRLSGKSPVYRYYRCADGRYVALGAIEGKFQRLLKEVLEPNGDWPADLFFGDDLEAMHRHLEAIFAGRSRDEWVRVFAGHDLCFSPVLTVEEGEHPTREVQASDGSLVSQPAGLFDRQFASSKLSRTAAPFGRDTAAVLQEAGCSAAEIERWAASGTIHCSERNG